MTESRKDGTPTLLPRVGESFTLVGRVSAALREEIVSGELEPQSRLKIGEIAARFGVSAIPVREALRSLATEGLVTPEVNKGFRVSSVGPKDLEETYSLRVLLDPLAVRLAVPNLSEHDISAAGTALDGMALARRKRDAPAYWRSHMEFHFAIYRQCRQSWLLKFVEALYANSDRYRPSVWKPSEARGAEHLAILKACRAADAQTAADLTEAHLRQTHSIRLPQLGAAETTPGRPARRRTISRSD